MPILSTKNIVKHFDGVYAVDHLSLAFEEGKLTSVIGPNGSGKSTLINTLTGMHTLDGGVVYVGKHTELEKIKAYEIAGFGMTRTFPNPTLF